MNHPEKEDARQQSTSRQPGSDWAEPAAFVRTVEPFTQLSEHEARRFLERGDSVTFPAGDAVIRRGEPARHLFIIRRGEARAIIPTEGESDKVFIFGPGDFFGAIAILADIARTADVFANTELHCIRVHREALLSVMNARPFIARFITKTVGERLLAAGRIESVGNYEITGRLGETENSYVFEARHRVLGTSVAIKMLPHELACDEEFVERFLRESLIMAGLSHPNIARMHDFHKAYATFFIVMEKVGGHNLRHVLETHGRLRPDRGRHILCEVAKALDFAHQQGIIHRDIKPANIMEDPTGRVVLLSFGLARGIADRDPDDFRVGTVSFMSPEQTTGRGVDSRSDIYSLGVTAYQLLTGDLPFEALSSRDVMRMHRHDSFEDPRTTVPDLPDDLHELICRSMAKEPEERFQCARDIIEFLGGLEPCDFDLARAESESLVFLFEPGRRAAVERAIQRVRDDLRDIPDLHIFPGRADCAGTPGDAGKKEEVR